jgi:hypothetical protein
MCFMNAWSGDEYSAAQNVCQRVLNRMQAAAGASLGPVAHAGKSPEDTDLPKALVKKIIKAKLTSLDTGKKSADPQKPPSEIQISKDALLACAESAKVLEWRQLFRLLSNLWEHQTGIRIQLSQGKS